MMLAGSSLCQALSFKFPFGLLVVLGSVNTMLIPTVSRKSQKFDEQHKRRGMTNLIVVDSVEPRENMDEQLRIPRVSCCHSLQVSGNFRGTIQRLATLDLINHLPVVQFDFPRVFCEPVEAVCTSVSRRAKAVYSGVDILQDRW